jgi:hypothetical protein
VAKKHVAPVVPQVRSTGGILVDGGTERQAEIAQAANLILGVDKLNGADVQAVFAAWRRSTGKATKPVMTVEATRRKKEEAIEQSRLRIEEQLAALEAKRAKLQA